jgi:hypothetical protein
VKAKPDEQASLIAIDAETFAVAAYVGQHGWGQVRLDRVAAGQLEELVVEAWARRRRNASSRRSTSEPELPAGLRPRPDRNQLEFLN